MRKSVKFLMLLMVICVSTFVSIAIYFNIQNAHDDFASNIYIESDGKIIKNLSVDHLSLSPGGKQEYNINLFCKAEGTYGIVMDYNENENGNGGLKNYVDVEIKVNDETIKTEKLSKLLEDGEIVSFSEDLYSDKAVVINVCYMMPNTIKNEAQGTFADFDIKITIEKE